MALYNESAVVTFQFYQMGLFVYLVYTFEPLGLSLCGHISSKQTFRIFMLSLCFIRKALMCDMWILSWYFLIYFFNLNLPVVWLDVALLKLFFVLSQPSSSLSPWAARSRVTSQHQVSPLGNQLWLVCVGQLHRRTCQLWLVMLHTKAC